MDPLMEGGQDDPWFWDLQRVIQEFCCTDRSWVDKNHQARNPSFETLASNLEKHDVTGELILTLDETMLNDFVIALTGTSFQQRSRVFRVIKSLKERSLRYKEWKKRGDAPGPPSQELTSFRATESGAGGLPSPNIQEIPQRGDNKPSLRQTPLRETPLRETPLRQTLRLTPIFETPSRRTPIPRQTPLHQTSASRMGSPIVKLEPPDYLPPQTTQAPSLETPLIGIGSPSVSHRGLPKAGTKRSFEAASAGMDSPIPSIETAEEMPLEAPRKKKRVAPTAASPSAVIRQEAFTLPGEVDGFNLDPTTFNFMDPTDGTSKCQKMGFLGSKHVRWEDTLGQTTDGLTIDGDFSNIRVKPIVAHSRRMNRSMRALLRPHPRGLKKLARACIQPPDPDSFLSTVLRLSGVQQDEVSGTRSDPVLAPFGEEEGDEDWDPQTLREMEEEKAEWERVAARQLPSELVHKIIDEAISEFVTRWKARKLDRLMNKAHAIWKKEHRSPNSQLNPTQARLAQIDARIATLRRGLTDAGWTSESALRHQALSLQQSVEDREEALCILNVLAGPEPEQRPELLVQPKRNKPRPLPCPTQSDEEILTSDEEEPLSNFIDNDTGTPMRDLTEATQEMEDHASRISLGDRHKAAAAAAATPLSDPKDTDGDDALSVSGKGEAPGPMDTDDQVSNAAEVIDLTVDSSDSDLPLPASSDFPDIPGLLDDDQPAEIDDTSASRTGLTALPKSFWDSIPSDITLTKNNDLLINRLWRLTTVTRNKLHEQAEASKDNLNDFWDKTIAEGLKNTVPVKTLPSLMTRLFIHWYDMESFSTFRLHHAREKPSRVREKRDMIAGFHAILLRVIPLFPRLVNMPGGKGKSAQQEIAMDAEALRMRELESERAAKLEKRRRELRLTLSTLTPMERDKSRLIVNEAKEDGESFIYVPGTPARLIKDHQIDGVRFLWNQIVVPPDSRHGCLLAHTMGLGKTMQVITLLLCIAASSNSPDPTVRSQIPDDLRRSRTVILCPPSLALNWRDEFLLWDTDKALGEVYIVTGGTSNMSTNESRMFRKNIVERWASGGGILILGYQLFSAFMRNSKEIIDTIHKRAAIVVADEAHMIKNLQSQLRQACVPFETRARIALTGSPLANSVSEYYSMMDWVAPGYMGPSSEFYDVYTRPIETGLWKDSTPHCKRTARIRLRALRENISAKVHRLNITALKDELPPKREFMIFVPPTPFQTSLYDKYVTELRETGLLKTCAWGAIGHLSLICAHPRCFLRKVRDVLADQGVDSNPPTEDEAPATPRNQAMEAAVALPRPIAEKLIALAASEADTNRPDLSWRVKHLMAILDECRAAGDKVLIFSRRIKVLDFVEELCRRQRRPSMRLDGETPVGMRTTLIKDFNDSTNSVEVFLISTRAGGVGLNIHGANRVVMLDFEHNPVHEQQAIGRAYRIGQTKPVFVYWFVVWGTHEAKLHGRMVFKNQLAQRVVDNKDNIRAYSASDVASWVRQVWQEDPKIPLPTSQAEALVGVDRVLDRILNDQEFRQGILSVVPTDTFEMEDPENTPLTVAELEEVQKLVSVATERRMKKPTPNAENGGGAGSTSTEEGVGAQRPRNMASQTAQPNNGHQPGKSAAAAMPVGYAAQRQKETTQPMQPQNGRQPMTPRPVGMTTPPSNSRGQPMLFQQPMGTIQPYNHRAQPTPMGATLASYSRGRPMPSQPMGTTTQPYNHRAQPTPMATTPAPYNGGQQMPSQPMGTTQRPGLVPTRTTHPQRTWAPPAPGSVVHGPAPQLQLGPGARPQPLSTFQALYARQAFEPAAAGRGLPPAVITEPPAVQHRATQSPMPPRAGEIRPTSPDSFPPLHELLGQGNGQMGSTHENTTGVSHTSSHEGEHLGTTTRTRDPQHLSSFLGRRNRERLEGKNDAENASPRRSEDEIALREIADLRRRRRREQQQQQQQPQPQPHQHQRKQQQPLPRWANDAIQKSNGSRESSFFSSRATPIPTPTSTPSRKAHEREAL